MVIQSCANQKIPPEILTIHPQILAGSLQIQKPPCRDQSPIWKISKPIQILSNFTKSYREARERAKFNTNKNESVKVCHQSDEPEEKNQQK